MPDVRVAKSLSHFRCAERACSDADRWNPERLTMRPLRSPCDDFEIRARGICRSCGKTRDLGLSSSASGWKGEVSREISGDSSPSSAPEAFEASSGGASVYRVVCG